jgi:uncharacterized YccA/Bax inhibitor family protein
MSNPVLNERTFRNTPQKWAPPQPPADYVAPVDDGPTSDWPPSDRQAMTVNGVITATASLFVLLLLSASVGWFRTETVVFEDGTSAVSGIPMLAWVGLFIGIGLTFFLMWKPHLAKFVAPVYAIAEGFFIGAISRAYETYYDGLVVQAAGMTLAVFAVMLVLYRTGVIRVTERFRKIVVTATIGVMVFYGITMLVRLFAGPGSVSFLASPSLLGIAFSIFVAGLAAFNLALDFDFIERGVRQGLEKDYEWYAAFGLLITIIWLYLEMLRLLAKLRQR